MGAFIIGEIFVVSSFYSSMFSPETIDKNKLIALYQFAWLARFTKTARLFQNFQKKKKS